MYPYSPDAAEDEPTMTDLRGVLPAQRPPVDATVLDEPTSEVPMIKPPLGNGRNGEGGRPATAEPEPGDTETAVLAAPVDAEPAADATEPDTTDLSVDTSEPDTADLSVDTTEPNTADLAADTADLAADTSDLAAEAGGLVAGPDVPDVLDVPDEADAVAPALTGLTEPGLPEPAEPATMIDPEPVDLMAPAEASEPAPSAADLVAGTDLPGTPLPGLPGDAPLTTDTDTDTDTDDAGPGIPYLTDPEVPEMVEPDPPHRLSEMAKMTWSPTTARFDPPEPTPAAPRFESEPLSAPVAESSLAAPSADLAEPSVDLAAQSVDFAAPPVAPPVDLTTPADPAEPVGLTEPAPEPSAVPVPARPGDVAESTIALWSPEAAARLRGQWRDLQVQFIDDPEAAVAGAKGLVTEAVHELADALLEAQDALDPYRDEGGSDTETMRVAMRRYREFLERVLAL